MQGRGNSPSRDVEDGSLSRPEARYDDGLISSLEKVGGRIIRS